MGNILLITGAAGFVGRYAVEFALKESKYDFILGTDIRNPDYPISYRGGQFEFLQADLTKIMDLQKIYNFLTEFSGYHITVWHIGGCFNYSAPRRLLYEVNVLGTKSLLEILKSLKTLEWQRFVFWSAGALYGDFNHPEGKLPADENYPINPQNDYAWSKKEAEDWVLFFGKNFGLPVAIMRIAAIYGLHSRYGMANAFLLNIRGQLAPLIAGRGNNKAALIHAEDVIRVADFLTWLSAPNGEIYNVVDNPAYTLETLSVFIGELSNNKPFTGFKLPGGVLKYLISLVNRRAKQLGGTPVIDPELGNLVLLNSWMSNKKLMAAAARLGRDRDLFKHPDSLRGIAETIEWYKVMGKEGQL